MATLISVTFLKVPRFDVHDYIYAHPPMTVLFEIVGEFTFASGHDHDGRDNVLLSLPTRSTGCRIMPKKLAEGGTLRVERIIQHIWQVHPGMPTHHTFAISKIIVERTWPCEILGKAVGIVMTNYIRHNLTDYQALLRNSAAKRSEARDRVADDLQAVLKSWAVGPAPRLDYPKVNGLPKSASL